jgi:hypothetical protein
MAVAYWDGSHWRNVGETLRCSKGAVVPHAAMGARGPLVGYGRDHPHHSVQLARWDGHAWSYVPPPAGIWAPRLAVLDDDSPVVAWQTPFPGSRLIVQRYSAGWRSMFVGTPSTGQPPNEVMLQGFGLAALPSGRLVVAWVMGGVSDAKLHVVEVQRCP